MKYNKNNRFKLLLISVAFLASCGSQKSLITIIEEDKALLVELTKHYDSLKVKAFNPSEKNDAQLKIQQLDEAIVLLKGRLERNSRIVFPPGIKDNKSIKKYIEPFLKQTSKSKADSQKKNKN